MRLFLCTFFVFCLAGCVHTPTPEQIAFADYGSYPNNYQELIQQYFSKTLLDPYSAQYSDWRGPSQGYWARPFGGEPIFGYRACVEVNAKNRMGGYTGSQQYFFMIRNGDIIYEDGGYTGGMGADQIANNCSSVSYTAPPSTQPSTSKQELRYLYGNGPLSPSALETK